MESAVETERNGNPADEETPFTSGPVTTGYPFEPEELAELERLEERDGQQEPAPADG